MEEAQTILLNNQYPLSFVENLINITFNKIITRDVVEDNEVNESSDHVNESIDDINENDCDLSIDPNGFSGDMLDKDKFRFYINYRGKPTEKYVQ